MLALAFTGCSVGSGPADEEGENPWDDGKTGFSPIRVDFKSIYANGGTESGTQYKTTDLALQFSKPIPLSSLADITLTYTKTGTGTTASVSAGEGPAYTLANADTPTEEGSEGEPTPDGAEPGADPETGDGVVKVARIGIGPTYTLRIDGIEEEGKVTVAIANSNYTFSPSSHEIPVYNGVEPTAVEFELKADGENKKAATTKLTLKFDNDIPGFDGNDIIFNAGETGANVDLHSLKKDDGSTYTLPVSGITKSGLVSVTLKKRGYMLKEASTPSAMVWVDPNGLKTITDLDLTGYIPAPVEGASPVWQFVGDFKAAQYTTEVVSWSPAHVNFTTGTEYTVRVKLKANQGYTFTGSENYLNHGEAALKSNNKPQITNINSGDTLDVTVTFRELYTLPAIKGTWYVASWGKNINDASGLSADYDPDSYVHDNSAYNPGTSRGAPLATIGAALTRAKYDMANNSGKYIDDISAQIVLLSDLSPEKLATGGNRIAAITDEHPPIILRSDTATPWKISMEDVNTDSDLEDVLLSVNGGELTLKDIALEYNDNGAPCYLNVIEVTGTSKDKRGDLTFESGVSIRNITGNPDPYNRPSVACGVSVLQYGVFTMNKGIISGNAHYAEYGGGGGGGVINKGSFTMNGGIIAENSGPCPENDPNKGGGVYNSGSFTMNGGPIRGNEASHGGGVYNSGSFAMNGGIIAGNGAYEGGGVYSSSAGGVSFIKSGGVIYGSDEGLAKVLMNTDVNGGAAVFNGDRWLNNTAWLDDVLDSTKDEGWDNHQTQQE
jgi:hypothetical protein